MLTTLNIKVTSERDAERNFWQALRRYGAEHAPHLPLLGVPLRRELRDGEEVSLLIPLSVTRYTLSLELRKLSSSGRVSLLVCEVDPSGVSNPVWGLELARSKRCAEKVFTKQLVGTAGPLSVKLAVRGENLIYKLHTD